MAQTLALLPVGADVDEGVLSAAFLALPQASFLLDVNGRILVCNRRAERLYCPETVADPAEMRGMAFSKLILPTSKGLGLQLREGAARGTATFVMKTARTGRTPSGTDFHMSLLRSAANNAPIYQLTQDHLKATADALSVMNERRIETRNKLHKLEAQYEALHQVMIATEAFAHAASHDLRTPLNTLSGLLQMFETKFGTGLPEKATEYLSYMSRAVVQMDDLTTDFLEHARSASADLVKEPVEIRPFLDIAIDDLQVAIDAVGAEVVIEGDGWPVMAEPALLRMLVNNVLGNALKYRHPERPLVLTITLEHTPQGGPLLSISDNGAGFSPSASEAIFLPFRRLNKQIEGSGIGLATCREVCRRHGWTITAQSDGDSGATFNITFVDA
ncbi:sensor histidine kinase [Tateyamaria sp. SN3-11]|uniref:sensor histidine kinase n=1 Tax=Tateyamaria sp. SN3-11 TaxID=3092147 RepID=UPI0039EB7506